MPKIVEFAAAAVLSLSAVAFTATAASAEIVCNGENVCWHVHHPYAYHPEWGVSVHPNHWRWGATEHYTWREHRGRGYWRNGVWVTF
jgi:hypothetical protein